MRQPAEVEEERGGVRHNNSLSCVCQVLLFIKHIAVTFPTFQRHRPLLGTNIKYLCINMVLCLAILTVQDEGRLIPLVVEQRGILNKSLAMQNICKLFPLIRNNVFRSGNRVQGNLVKVRACGSAVLSEGQKLKLFQGHYRNILDNAATLVAISEYGKNPFECHCVLEKLEHVVTQCYSNRSHKKDSKLPAYKRLDKMHGSLLMLLKRLLLGYDDVHSSNFLSPRGTGLLELNLSTEKRIKHKRVSTTLRKGACDASNVGNVWKKIQQSTGNNINKMYGDDPSHDVFQINFPHQFSKRIAPSINKYQPPERIFQASSSLVRKEQINESKTIEVDDSKWKLTADDAKKYINTSFVNLKDHTSGKCSGKTAFHFFRNKIGEKQLRKIYDLCSIDTDVALTPRKFGVLLHIIVLTTINKPPLPMPDKLPEILKKILHR